MNLSCGIDVPEAGKEKIEGGGAVGLIVCMLPRELSTLSNEVAEGLVSVPVIGIL